MSRTIIRKIHQRQMSKMIDEGKKRGSIIANCRSPNVIGDNQRGFGWIWKHLVEEKFKYDLKG